MGSVYRAGTSGSGLFGGRGGHGWCVGVARRLPPMSCTDEVREGGVDDIPALASARATVNRTALSHLNVTSERIICQCTWAWYMR